MQFVNRNVDGRQEVGHIDLYDKFSYIEVPERDAARVMRALDGTRYRGRDVRCNDADDTQASQSRGGRGGRGQERGGAFARFDRKPKKRRAERGGGGDGGRQDDWRQFFQNDGVRLKGDEPDFSEEGWARRKPRKK